MKEVFTNVRKVVVGVETETGLREIFVWRQPLSVCQKGMGVTSGES